MSGFFSAANRTAQYPMVTIVSQYGATQTETGKVYVAPATEGYTHDGDGNLLTDGRGTCSWDEENRLVQMIRDTDSPNDARQKLTFEYDYQGRRIRKTFYTYSGGWQEQRDVIYLYDGWNLVAEFNANASNAKLRTYVWGTDLSGTLTGAGGVGGLLWLTDHASPVTRHYPCYDGNGNVMGLVKADDGAVTARYDYGPFAEPIRATGPEADANPIRFSTKYTDNESGFCYYGYRYYSPTTGRWLSRDPLWETGGLNLNAFVRSSPLAAIDPHGRYLATDRPYSEPDRTKVEITYICINTPPGGFCFSPEDDVKIADCPPCTKRKNVWHCPLARESPLGSEICGGSGQRDWPYNEAACGEGKILTFPAGSTWTWAWRGGGVELGPYNHPVVHQACKNRACYHPMKSPHRSEGRDFSWRDDGIF